MAFRTIEVALRANVAQFQAQMGAAGAQVRAFGSDVNKTLTTADKNTQKSLKDVSTGALLMGGAMVAGFGVAVGASARFEKAMSGVQAVSGSTAAEMRLLSEAALQAGADTVFSASEAAQAQAELVKAGISTADVLGGALTGSLSLAAAGQLDLAQAAEISAQAMKIFGLTGQDVGHIADVLAAGANKSAADVGQLGDALRQGGLLASQTGLSLEETVGALAAFSDRALIGSDAGTSLKTMLQRLTPQSKEAAQLMEQLGFSAYDAQGNFIGLEGLAGELQSALAGMTAEQRNAAMTTLFGSDAVRAANVIYEEGAAGINDYVSAVNDQGAAARMAAIQMDNLSGDVEALKGSIETALIRSGSSGNAVLRELTQLATGATNAIGELDPAILGAGTALVGFGGSTLLVLGGIGTLIPRVQEARTSLHDLGRAGEMANTGLGKLGRVAGYAGILFTLAAAADLANNALNDLADPRKPVEITKLSAELATVGDSSSLSRTLVTQLGYSLDDLAGRIADVQTRGWFEDFVKGSRFSDKAVRELDESLANLVAGGATEAAAGQFALLEAELSRLGLGSEKIAAAFPQYTSAMSDAEAVAKVQAAATGKATDAQVGLNAALGGATAVTEAQKAEAEQLADVYKDLGDSVTDFVDPMDAYNTVLERNKEEAESWADAQNKSLDKTKVSWKDYMVTAEDGTRVSAEFYGDEHKTKAQEWAEAQNDALASAKASWEDYPEGVRVALGDVATEMETQIAAYDSFADNLLKIAGRGRSDVARELSKMGPEGAVLAAQFVTATDEEFTSYGDTLVEASQKKPEEAGKHLDNGFKILDVIANQGAGATVASVMRQLGPLPDLTEDVVRDTAARAGVVLAEDLPIWERAWAQRGIAAVGQVVEMHGDVPSVVDDTAAEANRALAGGLGPWSLTSRNYGLRLSEETANLPSLARGRGDASARALEGGLGSGHGPFGAIAGAYTNILADKVRPVAVSLAGGAAAQVAINLAKAADGALFYANGGMKENHVAQIAKAGDWRVWAEDETGGEAYIPLAPSKRRRSLDIWEETGRRLGVEHFDDGGFHKRSDIPQPPGFEQFGSPIRPAGASSMRSVYDAVGALVDQYERMTPALGAGIGWQAMWAAVQNRFPNARLHSGLRPGATTATGKASYHGMGRAIDVSPWQDIGEWIRENYMGPTREMIFSPMGGRQIHNGRDHMYSGITRAMHWDHVHWAMAKGGILNPHIRDKGGPLMPGYTLNGTSKPERVVAMAEGGFTTAEDGRRVPKSFYTASAEDAARAAEEARRAAEEAHRQRVSIHNNMFDLGVLPLADHLRNLEIRMSRERYASDEWVALHRQREQVLEEERRKEEENYRFRVQIHNNMFELGQISLADHVSNLDKRIARERYASDEWMRLTKQREDAIEQDYQRRVDRNNNLFEMGRLSLADHLGNLDRRIAREEDYTDEWVSLVRQREAVVEADYQRRREINDNLFELGRISLEDHLSNLDRRMAREKQFTDEWMALYDERERLTNDAIDKAKEARDAFAAPVREMGDLVGTFGRQDLVTGDEIVNMLEHRVEAAKRWDTTIRDLSGRGFDKGLIDELAKSGPQSLGLATGLLGVAPGVVNQALAALERTGSGLGGFFGPAVPAFAPQMNFAVKVYVGDREITDIVRTEVSTSNAATWGALERGVEAGVH